MKRALIVLFLMLVTVMPVRADGEVQAEEVVIETREVCRTVYGSDEEICEIIEVKKAVEAGLADNMLYRSIAFFGAAGLVLSGLYKATYRNYLFDR